MGTKNRKWAPCNLWRPAGWVIPKDLPIDSDEELQVNMYRLELPTAQDFSIHLFGDGWVIAHSASATRYWRPSHLEISNTFASAEKAMAECERRIAAVLKSALQMLGRAA